MTDAPDRDASFLRIEAAFLARRARRPDPSSAFAEAADRLTIEGPLLQAGHAIADALRAWSRAHGELPYHNRHHAAEATLAMAELCGIAARQGWLSLHEAQLGVVAMLGHDLEHDGRPGSDGVLEARSGLAVSGLAIAQGVSAPTAALLSDIIRGTDPALAAGNAARVRGCLPPGPGRPSQDLLLQLANEADLAASLLPRLGPRLGRALAREWRGRPGALSGIGTYAIHAAFLRAVPRLSRPAAEMGLDAARAASLAVYVVGGWRRGIATVDQGCAALDALDQPTARAAYARACSTLVHSA